MAEPAQNVTLQKQFVCPSSLVTLKGGETLTRPINFVSKACVLPVALVMAIFFGLPDLAEMFPLADDIDTREVPQQFLSSDSLLSRIIDAQLSDDQPLELLSTIRTYPALLDFQKYNTSKALLVMHFIDTEDHPVIVRGLIGPLP